MAVVVVAMAITVVRHHPSLCSYGGKGGVGGFPCRHLQLPLWLLLPLLPQRHQHPQRSSPLQQSHRKRSSLHCLERCEGDEGGCSCV